jgi:hydroxypyruvate isomerase
MKRTTSATHSANVSRRSVLGAAVAAGIGVPHVLAADKCPRRGVTKGRINQSVAAWCFKPMDLDTLCRHAVSLGIKSVELVDPPDWPTLKKHGLICAMSNSHGFVSGWNHKENYPRCIEITTKAIEDTAAAGFPNVITFPGFRKGMPDDVGLENTVEGIKKVIGLAEKKKVNLCMEVLNSRVNVDMKGHPDYMCDNVEFAVEVCKRVGSPRMKILFDIYHVQIMQGDVITRIRAYHEYIAHYHTAGNPGRNELDDNQEINYPPIMREIVKTGYTGYVGQEFIPTRDPITSLREGVELCDV